MNFDFIQDLQELLGSSQLFRFTIVGAKAAALLLMIFSILDKWLKSHNNLDARPIGDLFSILSVAFFIVSSDFIIDTIEQIFGNVEGSINITDSEMYTDASSTLEEYYDTLMEGSNEWYEKIGVFFSNLSFFIAYMLITVLLAVIKVADMAMTSGYLLVRIFFISLMKFLFPLVIALSTLEMTKNLLAKWIKLYIGLFVLGIFYIAIIKFSDLTFNILYKQFIESGDGFFTAYMNVNYGVWGMVVALIVAFKLKVSLFNRTTNFIFSFFT